MRVICIFITAEIKFTIIFYYLLYIFNHLLLKKFRQNKKIIYNKFKYY